MIRKFGFGVLLISLILSGLSIIIFQPFRKAQLNAESILCYSYKSTLDTAQYAFPGSLGLIKGTAIFTGAALISHDTVYYISINKWPIDSTVHYEYSYKVLNSKTIRAINEELQKMDTVEYGQPENSLNEFTNSFEIRQGGKTHYLLEYQSHTCRIGWDGHSDRVPPTLAKLGRLSLEQLDPDRRTVPDSPQFRMILQMARNSMENSPYIIASLKSNVCFLPPRAKRKKTVIDSSGTEIKAVPLKTDSLISPDIQ